MSRFKIIIEYDGTLYCGWQKQNKKKSIQFSIENALYKLSGIKTKVYGAGRTDAGVHALGQVAHFDLEKKMNIHNIHYGLNSYLNESKDNISILNVSIVNKSFDARFSVLKKHYLYRILNRSSHPTIDYHHVWWIPNALNKEEMIKGSKYLIGKHDFTTFRSSKCQAINPIRTIDNLEITKINDYIEINVFARSFLHRQVRSFVGSLVNIGKGVWNENIIQDILASKNRIFCGTVAPAKGLYLVKIYY